MYQVDEDSASGAVPRKANGGAEGIAALWRGELTNEVRRTFEDARARLEEVVEENG